MERPALQLIDLKLLIVFLTSIMTLGPKGAQADDTHSSGLSIRLDRSSRDEIEGILAKEGKPKPSPQKVQQIIRALEVSIAKRTQNAVRADLDQKLEEQSMTPNNIEAVLRLSDLAEAPLAIHFLKREFEELNDQDFESLRLLILSSKNSHRHRHAWASYLKVEDPTIKDRFEVELSFRSGGGIELPKSHVFNLKGQILNARPYLNHELENRFGSPHLIVVQRELLVSDPGLLTRTLIHELSHWIDSWTTNEVKLPSLIPPAPNSPLHELELYRWLSRQDEQRATRLEVRWMKEDLGMTLHDIIDVLKKDWLGESYPYNLPEFARALIETYFE